MKKNLHLAFLLFALMGFGLSKAQVCQVDPQYASPGIYPSDTLLDMTANVATNQVIQFVFPVDTVISGFTLPFDSFKVSSVSNIPTGLQWECNQNHPVCSYISAPPALTRGCVKVYGTPTQQNALYPGYDSLIVTGTAYVTLFFNVIPIAQDIAIYYRVSGPVSINSPFEGTLNMNASPNPMVNRTELNFNLATAATAEISVVNMMGEKVLNLNEGLMNAGQKSVEINTSNLAGGIYFVRLNLNDGEYVAVEKIAIVR